MPRVYVLLNVPVEAKDGSEEVRKVWVKFRSEQQHEFVATDLYDAVIQRLCLLEEFADTYITEPDEIEPGEILSEPNTNDPVLDLTKVK